MIRCMLILLFEIAVCLRLFKCYKNAFTSGIVTSTVKFFSLPEYEAAAPTKEKTSDLFSLDSIRSTLVRQEETIIFALIERAQYRRNYDIYNPKKTNLLSVYGEPLSFLEYMLIETEKLHAKVRRYTSPEEHPFFEALLPSPVLPNLQFPQILNVKKSDIDVNSIILRWYQEKIIDRLCRPGDDEQHGSSVLCDINCLQAISRRIHLGKFVAESKYLKNPELFSKLVHQGDAIGVLEQLTNVEVEKGVLRRALVKASHYGQDITGATAGYKIEPILIADIYRDMIIPLTKDVEVRYLFHRHGIPPPPPDSYYEKCRGPLDVFQDDNITAIIKSISMPNAEKFIDDSDSIDTVFW